jgi:DNA-binding NtrC family response regulator
MNVASNTPRARKKPSRAQHLLIVDDEPNVLLTLGMIFELDGYTVSKAASCAEALAMLGNAVHYDAVITDLNMERHDVGLEVARAALRLRPRPVVVICTGYADLVNTQAALDMRVDYFATKPVDLDELKHAIYRLRERNALAEKLAG